MTSDNSIPNLKSIILYGGTFNPIHQGHIQPVLEVAEAIAADLLIYLPCHLPPHKETPNVSSEHRLAMTQLALNGIHSDFEIQVSDFELTQAQASYSLLSIQHFRQRYPKAKLYFLMGMDSLLNFDTWYHWQDILQYCDLLVMQRPNYPQQQLANINPFLQSLMSQFSGSLDTAKIHIFSVDEVNMSSTKVRKQLIKNNENSNITSYILDKVALPESVTNYISQHGLYKN